MELNLSLGGGVYVCLFPRSINEEYRKNVLDLVDPSVSFLR